MQIVLIREISLKCGSKQISLWSSAQKWEELEKQSAQAGKSLARGQAQIMYQMCGATLVGNNLKNSILAKRSPARTVCLLNHIL